MNWRRASIGAAAVSPIVLLLGYGLTRDANEIPSPLPGRPAPAFALPVMEPGPGGVGAAEEVASLAAHRGEVVVLNFWASWCLACRDEHAQLSEAAVAYADRSVRFYGVLYNDTPDNARRWITQMGGQTYPTLLDDDARTAIDYGLYGVPETFFIGPDGTVAHKQIGPVTAAILRENIDALLAQRLPAADGAGDWRVDPAEAGPRPPAGAGREDS